MLICAASFAAWVGGCGKSGPRPPTKEELAAQAAAKQKQEAQDFANQIAAEQDALAKQAEDEELSQKRKVEESRLPPEFGASSPLLGVRQPSGGAAPLGPPAGVAPVYVPRRIPPDQAEGAVPYDQAFPPLKDRVVRIGIVSGSSAAGSGESLARMLTTEDRKYLEETLGLGIKVAYVSETERAETRRSRVFYRVPFMKAAVHIATLMPQPQTIEVMSEDEAARHQVDILVQIGTDLK